MDDYKIKDRFFQVTEDLKGCHSGSNLREKLFELGFEFFEDDDPNNDEIEEQTSKPKNDRQHHLILFLESQQEPSLDELDEFLTEIRSENPNYPLIRKYFRSSNKQLKKLFLYGLEKEPTNRDLLNGLAFYNEFTLNLRELINLYVVACRKVNELELFNNLVIDFYSATFFYDYNAIYELLHDENITVEKKNILHSIDKYLKEDEVYNTSF